MNLLPYLEARAANGPCGQVLNNCRTGAYIRRRALPRPHRSWEPDPLWGCDFCCPAVDDGDYTFPDDFDVNPAPWADPHRPASGEYFGFLVERMALQPSLAGDRRGGGTRWAPRTLVVTGTHIASTTRGTAYGEDWLAKALDGCDLTLRVLADCASPDGDEFRSWRPNMGRPWTRDLAGVDCDDGADPPVYVEARQSAREPVPPPAVSVSTGTTPVFYGDDAPVLYLDGIPVNYAPETMLVAAEEAAEVPIVDTGFRDLLGARLVSIDDLDDSDLPRCMGSRQVLVLEVLTEGVWWPADSPYALGTLIDEPFQECLCRPFDWTACAPEPEAEPCGVCGLPCHCAGSDVPIPVPAVGLRPCYEEPLSATVLSTLTPSLPWSISAALLIEISAGSEDLSNLKLQIHRALEGVPDPGTADGCRIYGARSPYAECLIPTVPAGTTLVLDGRRRRSVLQCLLGDRAGEPLAVDPDGRPFSHPLLACGFQWWVVLTADCYGLSPDSQVIIRYIPMDR